MIVSTTPTLEGRPIQEYLGVVTGETIVGANILKDFLATVRDIVGGRSAAYERTLHDAREQAIREMAERAHDMGADAVVGVTQSWGGDDFAWYTRELPGTYARLGTHRPGSGPPLDLHAGRFDVDERAIDVGVRLVCVVHAVLP